MSETRAAPIRHPLWRGRQPLDGFWLDAAYLGEAARRELLVRHWQPGARAFRFAEGDLLCLAQSSPEHCECLPFWPLRRQGGALCSAPLGEDELAGLPPADLHLVRGGGVVSLSLSSAEPLQPGAFLDLSGLAWAKAFDCREALPQHIGQPPETGAELHHILGARVAPSEARRAFFDRAERRGSGAPGKEAASLPGRQRARPRVPWHLALPLAAFCLGAVLLDGEPGLGLWRGLLFLLPLLLVLMWLSRRLQRARAWAVVQQQMADEAAVPPRKTATPPPRLPLWERLLMVSQLHRALDFRQAAYLRRMLRMFEDGQLDEALRHAIPLGDGRQSLGEALAPPRRREHLGLGPQAGPGRSLACAASLQEHLRKLYRASFDKLDREGRVEEAAFVLGELLRNHQEALDYLERHQHLAQAAELALAWERPAAQIVRLLCLAGEWHRAVQIARRDNAFADAIAQLEGPQVELAARLRGEWAEMLHARGELLSAVQVAWVSPPLRDRAAEWLRAAEVAGGELEVQALVLRALLLPDSLELDRERLARLRDDPQRHLERHALVLALLQHKHGNAALAGLARCVARASLADQARGLSALSGEQLRGLLKLSGDSLLQMDLPKTLLPRQEPTPLWVPAALRQWSAPAAGNWPIFDAGLLPGRRYLLALGENGVQLVDGRGRSLKRFAVPAQRLVMAHNGLVALALARREQLWRISHLDLVRGVARELGVLDFAVCADTFDGTGWALGRGRQLRVVDVDRDFDTLWQVADLPGNLHALSGNAQLRIVLVDTAEGLERWAYRQPEQRLVGRDLLSSGGDFGGWEVLGLDGELMACWPGEGDSLQFRGPDGKILTVDLPDMESRPWLTFDEQWLVLLHTRDNGRTGWRFIHRPSARSCATLDWPLAGEAQLRRSGEDWLIFDQQGRLAHVGVRQGVLHGISLGNLSPARPSRG